MEHLLFHLILEGIQAIDRRLQKPLGKLVPDLALLKADPGGYLAHSPVVVGPRRRHALATVIGLLAGAAVVAILFFAFRQMPRPRQPVPGRGLGLFVSFVAVAFVVRQVTLRWLVGGTMTLLPQGAELLYRDRSVFLPWDLFHAPGGPFEPDHRLIVLPINPRVPVAVSGPDG